MAVACSAMWAVAQADQPTAAEKRSATTIMLPPSPEALLPDDFDGWVTAEPLKTVDDPAQMDPANAAALKEYGFTRGVVANYKREGDTLSMRALRFEDVSGAFGAFSYYRQNGWPTADIGTRSGIEPRPRHLLGGDDGGAGGVFANRADVCRRVAGDRAKTSPGDGKQCAPAAQSWPICRRLLLKPRQPTTRSGRQATREQAACCRRRWWPSIRALNR